VSRGFRGDEKEDLIDQNFFEGFVEFFFERITKYLKLSLLLSTTSFYLF